MENSMGLAIGCPDWTTIDNGEGSLSLNTWSFWYLHSTLQSKDLKALSDT